MRLPPGAMTTAYRESAALQTTDYRNSVDFHKQKLLSLGQIERAGLTTLSIIGRYTDSKNATRNLGPSFDILSRSYDFNDPSFQRAKIKIGRTS